MRSKIITSTHHDGEVQRTQVVSGFSWSDLCFCSPDFDRRSICEIARLYRINIVRKDPARYGTLVFFHLPEAMEHPFSQRVGKDVVYSANVAASMALNERSQAGTLVYEGTFVSEEQAIAPFLHHLCHEGLLEVVQGDGAGLCFFAVSGRLGFASTVTAPLVVNSHFFVMDPTDLDSPYCVLGTPYGLMLTDGVILAPPLNGRPCLVIDRFGESAITDVSLTDLTIEIDTRCYRHGKGARFYARPDHRITPASRGSDIIITEARVVAVRDGGETEIPMAGFVLALDERITVTDPQVRFFGLEEYVFGVQVGPPMVHDAVVYQSLASPFYDRSGNGIPFPPTVYPMPYESARAARIAIGTDNDGKAVVIWAEGASKCRHVAGEGSSGSSLLELAHFCAEQGYTNIVNLDGGGSAQILFNGERALCISDRYDDNEEAERPVPMLLVAF